MAQDIIEFGGHANVILRAASDFTVNDINYKEGDVLLMLNDVDLDFTYNETIKDKTIGSRNILAFDVRKLNAITIHSNPLTTQYIQLFAEKMDNSFTHSVIEATGIADNMFFPVSPIIGEEVYVDGYGRYQVEYDEDSRSAVISKIIGTTEDGDDILEDNLEPDEYTVVYQTQEDKPVYNINNNYTLPYFSIEINALGNVNKEDGHIFVYAPRASLLTRPDYSLSDRITYQSLAFKLIDDEIKYGIY